jgi:hypothetical protein
MQISITPVPKAVSYKINKAFCLQDLSDEVNRDIRAGWTPIGGITNIGDINNYLLIQSMVLYSDKP